MTYEVIAIDNGSSAPLSAVEVGKYGDQFRYVHLESPVPSPCAALNYGVKNAAADLVMVCIDGARVLSPGILYYSLLASRLHPGAVIYTLAMHIGAEPQNMLAERGYRQEDEDRLLASVPWEQDGYLLFDVSTTALSSRRGYLSLLTESNCITLSRELYWRLGGYDERFREPGGGLANLDFFNRLNQSPEAFPIMLLGEATFHQFHGGTATNVPMKDHPFARMDSEYRAIHGHSFQPYTREPMYFGRVHPKTTRFLLFTPEGDSP